MPISQEQKSYNENLTFFKENCQSLKDCLKYSTINFSTKNLYLGSLIIKECKKQLDELFTEV